MGILNKTERLQLKKIYEQAYLEAAKKAKKESLNREITRIKEKAKADAQRKYRARSDKIKSIKKKGKSIKSKGKKFSSNMQKRNEYLMRQLTGY